MAKTMSPHPGGGEGIKLLIMYYAYYKNIKLHVFFRYSHLLFHKFYPRCAVYA